LEGRKHSGFVREEEEFGPPVPWLMRLPTAAGRLRQACLLNWRRLDEVREAALRFTLGGQANPRRDAGEEVASTIWCVMETTFGGPSLSVGMKIYDNDWFLTHQLEPSKRRTS
jgi:hypothetical protein